MRGHVAPAVNLDEGRRRQRRESVKIRFGKTEIAAIKPALAGRDAGEGNIIEGGVNRMAEDMKKIRGLAGGNQVMHHARDRACIPWSKPFLGRQKNINPRRWRDAGKRGRWPAYIVGR